MTKETAIAAFTARLNNDEPVGLLDLLLVPCDEESHEIWIDYIVPMTERGFFRTLLLFTNTGMPQDHRTAKHAWRHAFTAEKNTDNGYGYRYQLNGQFYTIPEMVAAAINPLTVLPGFSIYSIFDFLYSAMERAIPNDVTPRFMLIKHVFSAIYHYHMLWCIPGLAEYIGKDTSIDY